jgi:tetratricopeptide (TPR) repeat protein
VSEPELAGPPPPRRHRRRRRLLVLPLAVVLLAVGVKLVTMSWLSNRGVSAYDDDRYDQSVAAFDRLQVLNVVDPWRAHLGSGAALYGRDDLAGAEAAFRRALELAPQRCDVRFNLVVTIEARGDRLVADAEGADDESALQDGRSRYAIALDIAKGRLCPPSTAGDAGVRLEDARRRLQDKLGLESSAPEEELSAPVQREVATPDGEQGEPALQQIAERNQDGAAERQDVTDLDPSLVQDEGTSKW